MTSRSSRLPAALAAAALVVTWAVLLASAQDDVPPPPDPSDVVRKEMLVTDATGARLDTGGGLTPFRVELEGEDQCPGDSAHDQYRVDSYMVPIGVDPARLLYTSAGPTPPHFRTYESFQKTLHTTLAEPFAGATTAQQDEPGGPGPIRELPLFDFSVYGPDPRIEDWDGGVPEGEYRVGIACTFANRVANLWETTIRVSEDEGDEPVGIRWEVTGPQPAALETDDDASSVRPVLAFAGVAAVLAAVALALLRSSRRSEGTDHSAGSGGAASW